jgi:hypothetical protein
MKTSIQIISLTAFCLVILLTGVRNADSITLPYQDDFIINFDPKQPGANTEVTASVLSYAFDIDQSYITWMLNGTVVAQGTGEKSTTFRTGDIGSATTLYVSIVTKTNRKLEKTIKFTTGEIDLLWQASTYTPAFYKGKAKPVPGAQIKITVVPHGLGKKSSLIYDWRKNYRNLPNESGVGKSSFVFTLPDMPRDEVVKVKVWGPKKNYYMEKSITIRSEQPDVILYEEDPLEGPLYYESLPTQINIEVSDMTIRAEPYFFPKTDIESLLYTWTMNKTPFESLDNPNLVGVSRPEETGGYSIIEVNITNPEKILQNAMKRIKINF